MSRRRKGGSGARERRRGVGAPAREDAKKERGDGAEDDIGLAAENPCICCDKA